MLINTSHFRDLCGGDGGNLKVDFKSFRTLNKMSLFRDIKQFSIVGYKMLLLLITNTPLPHHKE